MKTEIQELLTLFWDCASVLSDNQKEMYVYDYTNKITAILHKSLTDDFKTWEEIITKEMEQTK